MAGAIRIQMRYDGQINDKMAGFYRSQYTHLDNSEYIAVTQFEESDARRAFPCMDHPAQKATFDISMDIGSDRVAISNGAIKEETPLSNGKKHVTFEQTPKMSTYLVFLGVGEFEFTQDTEDPRVRVATLPGMKPYATFGLEFGRWFDGRIAQSEVVDLISSVLLAQRGAFFDQDSLLFFGQPVPGGHADRTDRALISAVSSLEFIR